MTKYTAWHYFTPIEQKRFNENGDWNRKELEKLKETRSESELQTIQNAIMKKIEEFENKEASYKEKYGKAWSEMFPPQSQKNNTVSPSSMRQALRDGVPLDELPGDMDYEDYLEQRY